MFPIYTVEKGIIATHPHKNGKTRRGRTKDTRHPHLLDRQPRKYETQVETNPPFLLETTRKGTPSTEAVATGCLRPRV